MNNSGLYSRPCFVIALLIVGCVMFSASAYSSGTTQNGNITLLHYWKTHSGLLVRHAEMINPDVCDRVDKYILDKNHPYYKEMYSMMLAAQMAKRPLVITVDGCFEGFPSIAHVYSHL